MTKVVFLILETFRLSLFITYIVVRLPALSLSNCLLYIYDLVPTINYAVVTFFAKEFVVFSIISYKIKYNPKSDRSFLYSRRHFVYVHCGLSSFHVILSTLRHRNLHTCTNNIKYLICSAVLYRFYLGDDVCEENIWRQNNNYNSLTTAIS